MARRREQQSRLDLTPIKDKTLAALSSLKLCFVWSVGLSRTRCLLGLEACPGSTMPFLERIVECTMQPQD